MSVYINKPGGIKRTTGKFCFLSLFWWIVKVLYFDDCQHSAIDMGP